MHTFNWVDIFIITVVGLSILISLIRGFVREALSLAGWIIAIWIAVTYCSSLAVLLQAHIKDTMLRTGAAFLILLIATLIVAGLVNYLISQFVQKTGLSGTDRLLGAIFGFIRGALLVALLLLLGQMTPLPEQAAWQQSMLVPSFHPLQQWLTRFLPDNISSRLDGTNIPDQVITQSS